MLRQYEQLSALRLWLVKRVERGLSIPDTMEETTELVRLDPTGFPAKKFRCDASIGSLPVMICNTVTLTLFCLYYVLYTESSAGTRRPADSASGREKWQLAPVAIASNAAFVGSFPSHIAYTLHVCFFKGCPFAQKGTSSTRNLSHLCQKLTCPTEQRKPCRARTTSYSLTRLSP